MTILMCCSHTVRGTCTFGYVNDVAANSTLTIPEGVYWTDPLCVDAATAAIKAVDSTDLVGRLAYLMDAACAGTVDGAYQAANYGPRQVAWAASDADVQFRPAGANTEGLRVYKRVGSNPTRTTTHFSGTLFATGYAHGNWGPSTRLERNFSQMESPKNTLGSNQTWGGSAWTARLGVPLSTRNIVLNTVAAAQVRNEQGLLFNGGVGADTDGTMETTLWPYLAAGEMVRVYSDNLAVTTYNTTAMTATDTSVAVAERAGFANSSVAWIDGEQVFVVSGAGSGAGTLQIERNNPVAHNKYSPMCVSHVATYVIGDGGNINAEQFAPERLSPGSPFYNLDISLKRTRWST